MDGLVHVHAGTPVQSDNHGEGDLVVPALGTPPEDQRAELLPSALPQGTAGGAVDYSSEGSDA